MNELVSKIGDFSNGDAARLLDRAGQTLPPWISLLLVVGIAWQLASLGWSFAPGDEPEAPNGGPAAGAGQPNAAQASIGQITARNMFGSYVAPDTPTDSQAGGSGPNSAVGRPLSATTLALTLKGTIWDSDSDRAVAIIFHGGKEEVYSIGDTVVAGATLYSVEPRRVVLQRPGDRLEELALAELSEISGSTGRTRRTTPTRRQVRTTSQQSDPNQGRAAAIAGAMSQVLRPQPHFVDNQLRGFRVYPGRQRQVFSDLGLRPGDLVIDINGMPMTDPQQSAQLLSGLDTNGAMTVTVERNGSPEVLTIDMAQVNSAISRAGDSPANE